MSRLAIVLLVTLAAAAPSARAAMTCSDVFTPLYPCLGYIQRGGAPTASCCSGVRSLMAVASTTADRRTVCGCLKTVATGVSGQYLALAGGLPAKCGVNIPYKIRPSTNCNNVK